ncbi:MAG: putative ABC transporter permease [Candidatus Hydrogenedens sp.]
MNYHKALVRFIIFALFGLVLEVFMSSIDGLIFHDNVNLRGHTSLWMIFDYGLIGILTPWLRNPLKAIGIPFPVRAFVYMLIIFIVEYFSGLIFHKILGLNIWNYSQFRYNLHGQITLEFVPVWYTLSLTIEKLYEWVDKASWAILTKNPEGYLPD